MEARPAPTSAALLTLRLNPNLPQGTRRLWFHRGHPLLKIPRATIAGPTNVLAASPFKGHTARHFVRTFTKFKPMKSLPAYRVA